MLILLLALVNIQKKQLKRCAKLDSVDTAAIALEVIIQYDSYYICTHMPCIALSNMCAIISLLWACAIREQQLLLHSIVTELCTMYCNTTALRYRNLCNMQQTGVTEAVVRDVIGFLKAPQINPRATAAPPLLKQGVTSLADVVRNCFQHSTLCNYC